ncbi:Spy/CpxP family protein refolding chaperone [Tenacibaculum sp.]|uniref:Spy/CpxP family protein refolding chaperone n=1 Tax=Tenacibaculum sp. TaxID=1906242 RepID=UPI003AA96684
MKKLLTLLILAVSFTVTTQAQKRDKTKHEELSTEQKTELAVKKMTLQLDLTEAQQNQIRPLIAEQVAERQKMWAKRKAMKESGKKATADERYAMKSHMLDKKIAHKSEMKRILNKQQYERYEKMNARKMKRHKKKATHKKLGKGEHHKKHQEEK